MALQKLSVFRASFDERSRPKIDTIVAWIKSGQIYGRKYGKIYYVDPDKEPEKTQKTTVKICTEAMSLVQQAQS